MEPLMIARDATPDPGLLDRAEGAFLGAAVGDALGWPVEDRSGRIGGRRDLEPSFQFISWWRREGGRFQPHEEEIAPGSYSDDTQLTLAVARARLAGTPWWNWLTAHELPFWLLYERGGGGATKRAATSWSRGKAPWADKDLPRYLAAGGNGVAMRIAPHCVVTPSFDEVAAAVIADGISTHGHPRALVGGLLQAYAVHRSLFNREVLAYGELIEDVLAAPGWRHLNPPDNVAPEWEDVVTRGDGRPYRDLWNEVVDETEQMLRAARDGIAHGALSVDRPVLERVGAFGKNSGAGNVTAVAALFLASRYASQPSGGVVAASFAKGADTDTLAAMAGAILGAIHGTDWLGGIVRNLQDASYVRRLAHDLVNGVTNERSSEEAARPTTRTFWRQFGEPEVGAVVELPGARSGTVRAVAQHPTKRADLLPLTWIVGLEDGQTIYLKRVKKVPKSAEPPPPPQPERRPRIGVVLHVDNVFETRRFYEQIVGLRISKESPERIVFEGLLALEPLPRSLRETEATEQLALDTQGSKPSFDTRCALTLYLGKDDFEVVRGRIEAAGRPLSKISANHGRPTFRCQDPDGNVVEFRSLNGA
jgi:ADP-ribosylglycohydrolase/catechol 2,3-dioxygenase-like lactoylglutathione lyase family enzyme